MEDWQRKHITDNLPKLISMTQFNTSVLATLQSEGILSEDDISSSVSDQTNNKSITFSCIYT